MFLDEEKKTKSDLDQKRDYYDSYFDDLEKEEQELEQKKVTIDDPVEPKKFALNLVSINVLACLIAMGFFILAKLFQVVGVAICYAIFYYIGAILLLCGVVCYIIQIFKNRKLAFEPQLVILLLALFVGLV